MIYTMNKIFASPPAHSTANPARSQLDDSAMSARNQRKISAKLARKMLFDK